MCYPSFLFSKYHYLRLGLLSMLVELVYELLILEELCGLILYNSCLLLYLP